MVASVLTFIKREHVSWISFGKRDTRVHFDDDTRPQRNGLLHTSLNGKKREALLEKLCFDPICNILVLCIEQRTQFAGQTEIEV